MLAALVFLIDADLLGDARAREALDLLRERQRADGRWAADRQWWALDGRFENQREVVDWGAAGEPSAMITFHALRILASSA